MRRILDASSPRLGAVPNCFHDRMQQNKAQLAITGAALFLGHPCPLLFPGKDMGRVIAKHAACVNDEGVVQHGWSSGRVPRQDGSLAGTHYHFEEVLSHSWRFKESDCHRADLLEPVQECSRVDVEMQPPAHPSSERSWN